MILWIDTTAVVGDFEDRVAELGPPPDRDVAGNAGLEVFQGIIDQIRKNLFERQAVAGDVRQRLDADLCIGLILGQRLQRMTATMLRRSVSKRPDSLSGTER